MIKVLTFRFPSRDLHPHQMNLVETVAILNTDMSNYVYSGQGSTFSFYIVINGCVWFQMRQFYFLLVFEAFWLLSSTRNCFSIFPLHGTSRFDLTGTLFFCLSIVKAVDPVTVKFSGITSAEVPSKPSQY